MKRREAGARASPRLCDEGEAREVQRGAVGQRADPGEEDRLRGDGVLGCGAVARARDPEGEAVGQKDLLRAGGDGRGSGAEVSRTAAADGTGGHLEPQAVAPPAARTQGRLNSCSACRDTTDAAAERSLSFCRRSLVGATLKLRRRRRGGGRGRRESPPAVGRMIPPGGSWEVGKRRRRLKSARTASRWPHGTAGRGALAPARRRRPRGIRTAAPPSRRRHPPGVCPQQRRWV